MGPNALFLPQMPHYVNRCHITATTANFWHQTFDGHQITDCGTNARLWHKYQIVVSYVNDNLWQQIGVGTPICPSPPPEHRKLGTGMDGYLFVHGFSDQDSDLIPVEL